MYARLRTEMCGVCQLLSVLRPIYAREASESAQLLTVAYVSMYASLELKCAESASCS